MTTEYQEAGCSRRWMQQLEHGNCPWALVEVLLWWCYLCRVNSRGRYLCGLGLWPRLNVGAVCDAQRHLGGTCSVQCYVGVEQLKWNGNETETKQVSKLLLQPKQSCNVLAVLIYLSRYPLFMQNCCLWFCQSNSSQQTWRSYALL